MRRPKLLDQNARRAAVMGLAAKSLAPVVRDALRDRGVRKALDDTYGSGRRVYTEVRGSEPKDLAARVARDESLQAELAAMVRSAARAFDEGVSATKRRARRRLTLVAAIIGGALALIRIRSRREDGASTSSGPHGGLDRGISDADTLGRATAAPAAHGLAEH